MASRLDFSQIRSLYVGTSSGTTVDTNNLIVVGSVGIGTTSPGTALVVEGGLAADATVFIKHTNANGYSGIDFFENTGTHVGSLWHANSGAVASNQNAMTLAARTAGDKVYIVAGGYDPTTSGGITVAAGNVGIGTTSPSYRLDVSGVTRFQDIVRFKTNVWQISDNDAQNRLYFGGGGRTYFGSGDGYEWRSSGDTALAVLTNAGNLGIGTTAPDSLLHISGSGNTFARYTNTTSAGHFVDVGANSAGQSFVYGYGAYPLLFATNGSERMRITSGGNVGIGTTSPQLTNAGRGNVTINGSAESIAVLSIADAWKSYWFVTSAASYLASEGNRPLYLESGGGVRVSILGSGYVGIDNTNPGSLLTVGTQSIGTSGSGVAQDNSIIARFGASNAGARVTGVTIANTAAATVGNNATLSFVLAENYSATGLISSILQNTGTARTDMAFSVYNVNDNYERMRITGGGNVGIGTTAPASILHVSTTGANAYSSTITKGSNMKGIVNTLSNNADDMVGIYFATGTNAEGSHWSGITGSRSQSATDWSTQLNFYTHDETVSNITDATQKMVIKGNGNVGIGTTAPSYKLHVNGAFGANPGAYVSGDTYGILGVSKGISNASAGVNYYQGSTQKWFTGVYENSDNYGFYSVGTAGFPMVIQYSTGNVGIGTTSPAFKLEVNAGANAGVFLQGSSDVRYHVFSSSSSDWVGYELRSSNVNSFAGGMFRNNASNDRISIYNKNAEAISILDTGNVGIGTTSPFNKLTVGGVPDGGYGLITISSAWASGSAISTGIKIGAANDTGSAGVDIRSHSNYAATSGTEMSFWTNSTANVLSERMRITSAGNVGIGTTSPDTPLSSARGIVINSGASNDVQIRMQNNTTGSAGSDGGLLSISGSQMYLWNYEASNLIFGTSNAERMRIVSGGNVGIGTTSPDNKLTVKGDNALVDVQSTDDGQTVGFLARYLNNATLGGAFRYTTGDAQLYIDNLFIGNNGVYSDINIRNCDTGGNLQSRIKIKGSSGNVGIGTTAPVRKLHIDGGSITSDTPTLRISSTDGSGTNKFGIEFYSNNGADVRGKLLADNSGKVYLDDAGGGGVIIAGNGGSNVGIGTTSPSYKLDVVGDSRITSGSLGVGVAPNATDGRIDASNDIVAFSSSDLRLKENVTPIENALDKVKSLTGVEFDWNPELKHAHGYEGHDTGVIAQEVQDVMPTAIRTNDTGYLAVRYEKLIGLLIEGMKEQQKQIDELKSKLK